jgi:hypothetical protein
MGWGRDWAQGPGPRKRSLQHSVPVCRSLPRIAAVCRSLSRIVAGAVVLFLFVGCWACDSVSGGSGDWGDEGDS